MSAQPQPDEHAWPVDAMLEIGLRHHEAGRLNDAAMIYNAILGEDPDHADSLHLLGMIFHRSGQLDRATACIGRALELTPTAAHYHNSLGSVLRDLGRATEAVAQFAVAARLRPESPQIFGNLGTALHDTGNAQAAITAYCRALALDPGSAETWYNLGAPLSGIGCAGMAEAVYRRALRLRPAFAEASFNLGNELIRLRRLNEAEAAFRHSLRVRADHAECHNNLGVVFQEQSRLEAAEASYRAALRLDPDYAQALYNLGCIHLAHSRLDEAAACYDRALELKPDHAEARLARCMGELPILYADSAELVSRRCAYEARLRQLAETVARGEHGDALADAIGSSQPFFLPYQGADDRRLQSLYGSLACQLLARRHPPATLPPPPAPGQKIRVGIVSGCFHEHTIWRLFLEGWLKHLDRRRFEIFGYHTGSARDGLTDIAAASCDRFVEGFRTGRQWRETILADAPHVLLYPEVGMDPMAGHLAAQRLAPVQCVSWGHPNTTGLPTMDYFLSSDLMEPSGAETLYTERLIRLPNLATCYEARAWPPSPPRRDALGLRPAATVYWSGQALYKYLPQYDDVFPRIARAAGDCQFVFIAFAKSRSVTDLFRSRLERAFAAHGLLASEHSVILPSMPQERFIDAVRQCDVLLDTIGWSGGKSTLDSLAHDAPIVTLPGRFMRGRHTAAILTRMGVTETIAASVDGYVDIAVQLAGDREWRESLRNRMAAERHRVFGDHGCIEALENFLLDAVERSGSGLQRNGRPALPRPAASAKRVRRTEPAEWAC